MSELSTVANGMANGTWATLNTLGFANGNILRPGCGGSALEQVTRGVWNPVNDTVMIWGVSHNNCTGCEPMFLVKYTESNNTWSALNSGCPATGSGTLHHGYSHFTINPYTGDAYHRAFNTKTVNKYSHSTQTWTGCTDIAAPSVQVAGALTYFPERNSLTFLDGDWGFWEATLTSSCTGMNWVLRANTAVNQGAPVTLAGLAPKHHVAEHSAICHCIIFGGDTTPVYSYNADGTFTSRAAAPDNIGVQQGFAPWGSAFTHDPATGDILIWAGTAGTAYKYNPTTNVWSATGIGAPLFPGPEGATTETVTIPIPKYNVIMFVQVSSGANGAASVRLYKHSSPITADMDFAVRASSPDVISYNGFDSASDISGQFGDGRGTNPASGNGTRPTITAAQKASGAGSMNCFAPAGSDNDPCGNFFTRFTPTGPAPGTTIGPNSNVYIQWRQRFDTNYITGSNWTGNGWKYAIISGADGSGCTSGNTTNCTSSCTAVEVVPQNNFHRGFLHMYNSCTGSASHGPFDPWDESVPEGIKLQNNMPSPFCLHGNLPALDPPSNNCFKNYANEWMTFQVHIQTGPCVNGEFANSHVDVWIAREGQTSTKVFNWGPYNLSSTANCAMEFGKVWLLGYNTAGTTINAANTWFDELIISRSLIPDPGVVTVQSAPEPPTNLVALAIR